MKSTKSLPILLFAVTTALFGGLYVVLLAWAHTSSISVSAPGISITKSQPNLYVNTTHPWNVTTGSNSANVTRYYTQDAQPNLYFVQQPAGPTFVPANSIVSGTGQLNVTYSNPPTGNYTLWAITEVEVSETGETHIHAADNTSSQPFTIW